MKLSSVSVSMAAVAILAGGIALWPANAQPAGDKPAVQPPAGEKGPGGPGGPRGGPRAGEPASEWRDKLRDELRDHPRLGRSLLAMHEARDYLEKAPNEFGGHKKAAIDSLDAAIKEVTEALKFDPKVDPADRPAGGRPNRGRPDGGKPEGGRPAGDPAPKP